MPVSQQWRQAGLVLVATLALLSIAYADAGCAEGYRVCDKNVTNGCETNIYSDPRNYGECRAVRREKYGYVSVCNKGKCGFVCAAGYANCNDSTENGCETYIRVDVNYAKYLTYLKK